MQGSGKEIQSRVSPCLATKARRPCRRGWSCFELCWTGSWMLLTRGLQLSPDWCLLKRKLGLDLWPASIQVLQRALQQAGSSAHLQGLMTPGQAI